MKVWSLLPSATEILFTLGLGGHVTGVTHECDYPPEAASKPRVTFSHVDSSVSSREIDEQVSQRMSQGLDIYGVDLDRLRSDPPDVIITQDLCPVCAVSPSDFAAHLEEASRDTRIVTLNPNTLTDVVDSIGIVGAALDKDREASELMESLRHRLDVVSEAVAGAPVKRVLTLEWLDPLMPGGHWVPDMVQIAGGEGGPIAPGEPSRKVAWDDLRTLEPDVIVLMPCGFSPERADTEARNLWDLPGWSDLGAVRGGEVYCVDGNQRYSRPGPRLVDGVEELAHLLHSDRWPVHPPRGAVRKLGHGEDGGFAFAPYA